MHKLRWAALILGATVATTAASASATTGVTASRLAGSDRYATAATIAEASFQSGSAEVIIASGLDYPDALAASYADGQLHAPVLLTDPNNLPSATQSALSALHASGAEVIGGTAAVSANVVSQLQAAGLTVQRISGADRYATAAAVAQAFPTNLIGSYGTGGPTAIVTSGLSYADALAGGPMAAKDSFPVLLTDPSSLSSPTQSALTNLGIKQVILLGGTAAVSSGVQTQITNMGISVTRIGGADRTQTATMVADFEAQNLGWTLTHVNLARGNDFADALAGASHAGLETAPIILTEDPNTLGSYTTSWLQTNSATIATIHVFGGTAAVSDATVSAAQSAAQ